MSYNITLIKEAVVFFWQADEYAHPILEDDPLPVEIGRVGPGVFGKTLGILELDQTIDAVDERDPAPPNMCETVPKTGYSPYQLISWISEPSARFWSLDPPHATFIYPFVVSIGWFRIVRLDETCLFPPRQISNVYWLFEVPRSSKELGMTFY